MRRTTASGNYGMVADALRRKTVCTGAGCGTWGLFIQAPLMVDKLINDGTATVEVLDTTSKWFGVTYPEDRQSVVDKIQALVDAGEYPAKLF